jgi:putative hydrolase of the HAD superfamily
MARLVRGKIAYPEFWNALRAKTGITASDDELAARWIRDYEEDFRVKETVEKARAKGYKTCVCTNNNGIRLPALIKKYGLNDIFDCIVSSHEVGHTKPEREIFEALLNGLGVKPEELVYSDDNPDRLKGAQELGIEAFVFHDFGQFLKELEKRGVMIGKM